MEWRHYVLLYPLVSTVLSVTMLCVYYVNYLFTLAELELSCSMEALSAVIKYLEVSVL